METPEQLSPWWRHAVIVVLVLGFSVLIWQAVRSYQDAPPIPDTVVGAAGDGDLAGQSHPAWIGPADSAVEIAEQRDLGRGPFGE